MNTKRQAANKANARRSTGPKTPEGKSRSSQNARKHGFCAANYTVVRLEDLQAIDKLRTDLIHDYQPVNAQELYTIERIALAQHNLLRLAAIEAGLFTACINESIDPNGRPVAILNGDMTRDISITIAQNRAYYLAEGFIRQSQSQAIPLFLRYQAQAERLYRRAIEEFTRLKALRPELPNEAITDSQPEETKADAQEGQPYFEPLNKAIPPDPTIAIPSPNPPNYRKR